MPISATGNNTRHRSQYGFTLVEVLTVVVILGLMAGVVVLSLPTREDPGKVAAFRLAMDVRAAQERAITHGELAGLSVTGAGWDFSVYRRGAWQDLTLPGTEEAGRELPPALALSLLPDSEPVEGTAGGSRRFSLSRRGEEEEAETMPVILFFPAGDVTAFTATITGPLRDWRVVMAADGTVRVEAINE